MRPFRKQLNIRQHIRKDMVGVRKRRPHGSSRARMRSFGVARYRYLAVIPVLLAAIVLVAWIKMPPLQTVRYRPVRYAINNPLMGWAVDATLEPEAVEVPHTLVHATLSWRELEPVEGEYTFEAFERENHIDEWRALGMRVIIRFVLDRPGSEFHMDIPDWLYEGMGDEPGVFYDTWVGQGFSPNYDNFWLRQRHGDALAQLGARYNSDPFVAFIELGSLGHDGEWWVDRESGVQALPPSFEVRGYISAYVYAFPDTPMLAVNPYQSIQMVQAGLYNPFLGDADRTWNWIDMVTYGGYEEQIGTDLRGMGEFYKAAPSGAQFAKQAGATSMLAANTERLLDQLQECHTTYVSGAPATGLSEDVINGMRIAQSSMGYRLWVRSAQWPWSTRRGENMRLNLQIRNSGVAPISQSWPLRLSLIKEGEEVYGQNTRVDIRTWLPGESRADVDIDVPITLEPGSYQIGLSILDPATGEPGVELAMVSRRLGLISILGDVEVVH